MARRNLGIVIAYEVRRTLIKPQFWLATLAVPLLIGLVAGLSVLSGGVALEREREGRQEPLAFTWTDASGLVDADVARQAGGTRVADAEAARRAVVEGRSDLHIDYPADPTKQPLVLVGRDIGLIDSARYEFAAAKVLRASVETRIADPTLARLARGGAAVQLTTYADGEPTPGWAGAVAPGVFLVLFYLVILMLGSQMMTITLEEKENRVTEMILTTIHPTPLIVGKIIGVVLVGIVQMSVVAVPSLLFLSRQGAEVSEVLGQGGLPTLPPGPLVVEAWPVALSALLAFGGFVMFTGLLVSIGSVMPTAKDAAGAFGVVVVAVFLPFYLLMMIVTDPASLGTRVLTYFPLTAPVTGLLRNASGSLGGVEAIAVLAVIYGSAALFLALGVRLFRSGAISYDARLDIVGALRRRG